MSIIQLLLSQDWEEEVDTFEPGDESFTFPGTYSFLVPSGVTEVSAVCVGAGGGGSGFGPYAGSGGGGGGLSWGTFDVTPGETLTVEVGAGGTGGSKNSGGIIYAGLNGGPSRIIRGSTVLLEGYGGQGGTYAASSTWNFGGAGIGGTSGGIERDGGGNGGDGGNGGGQTGGAGGGGGGGYSGKGGNGASGGSFTNGFDGEGGGGGGGSNMNIANAPSNLSGSINNGGGTGLDGEGFNGIKGLPSGNYYDRGGGGGSGGQPGGGQLRDGGNILNGGIDSNIYLIDDYAFFGTANWYTMPLGPGGDFGGGGGSIRYNNSYYASPYTVGKGGRGGVRIIWGENRFYPNTNVLGYPVYTLSGIPETLSEGETLSLEFTAAPLAEKAKFYYYINGIQSDDLSVNVLTPAHRSLYIPDSNSGMDCTPSNTNILTEAIEVSTSASNFNYDRFNIEWWWKLDGPNASSMLTTSNSAYFFGGEHLTSASPYDNIHFGAYYINSNAHGLYHSPNPNSTSWYNNTYFSSTYVSRTGWNHLAFFAESGTTGYMYFYTNGIRRVAYQFRRNHTAPIYNFTIGNFFSLAAYSLGFTDGRTVGSSGGGDGMPGWYSNLRVTAGYGGHGYGGLPYSYTLPTAPQEVDANTIMLQHGDQLLSGYANNTWTTNLWGNAQLSDENPFGIPTTGAIKQDSNGQLYGEFETTEPNATTTINIPIAFDAQNITENETLSVSINDANQVPIAGMQIPITDVNQFVTITTPVPTAREGNYFDFSLELENFGDGQQLYYDFSYGGQATAMQNQDVLNTLNSFSWPGGTLTISNPNNLAIVTETISVWIRPDAYLYENESFYLRLWRDAALTIPFAESNVVTIENVSPQANNFQVLNYTTQQPTNQIDEGYSMRIRMDLSAAGTGNYLLIADPVSSADYQYSATSNVSYDIPESGSQTLEFIYTTLFDTVVDTRQVGFKLYWASTSYLIEDFTTDPNNIVTINDVAPSYALSTVNNVTTMNENETTPFQLETQGVPIGETLYYTVGGTVTAEDVSGGLSGSFTTTGVGTGNYTDINLLIPAEVTQGDDGETIYIEVRTGSISGPVVATSPTVTIADAAAPTGIDITTQFYAIPGTQINSNVYMGSTVDYTGPYDVSEVQTDFVGTGRVYLGVKVTSLPTFYNDVPIGGVQILDAAGTSVLQSWVFSNTGTHGWTTIWGQFSGTSSAGLTYTPTTVSGYSGWSTIGTGGSIDRFTLTSNTGSSYTGAADGISTTAWATTPFTLGAGTISQASGTYYAYRETSGSTRYSTSFMRSPQHTFGGGERIRVCYAITGTSGSPMTATDTIHIAVI